MVRTGWERTIMTKYLRIAIAVLLLPTLALGLPRGAAAVTPESPEVKAVIDKAFKYLETADDNRLGGKCLIGLAFLKNGGDEKHAKVDAAVQACLAATRG